jgi:hypothetical protein
MANNGKVFEDNKTALLTVAVIVGVSLIAFNIIDITGNVVTNPNSLTISQEKAKITVQVNYPVGKYGRSNNVIYMKMEKGTRSMDEETDCDRDYGYQARGNSKCIREIADFDIRGSTWKAGDIVVFSVKNTDISRRYVIR